MSRSKRLATGFVAFAVIVAVAGCSSRTTPGLSSSPPGVPLKTGGTAISHSGNTGPGSILDDMSTPGLSVPEAKKLAADGLIVPAAPGLGSVTRAMATNEGGPRSVRGLALRYDAGVDVFAEPGVGDTGWTVRTGFPDLAQFTDGRKQPYDVVSAQGNDFIVQRGGTQVLESGKRVEVKPAVVFLYKGTRYTLQSISGSMTADDLLNVALSMK